MDAAITDSRSGSSKRKSGVLAAQLPQLSSDGLPDEKAKDDTNQVEMKLYNYAALLSILQGLILEIQAAGIQIQTPTRPQGLAILLPDVIICPTCSGWRVKICPTCAGASSTETEAA